MEHIKTKYEDYYLNDNGQKHGEYKQYYTSGKLEFHCYYNNNILHGEYKQYYPNGKLGIHCHYINGKRYSLKEYKEMKLNEILK